jgi:hypothetical protein
MADAQVSASLQFGMADAQVSASLQFGMWDLGRMDAAGLVPPANVHASPHPSVAQSSMLSVPAGPCLLDFDADCAHNIELWHTPALRGVPAWRHVLKCKLNLLECRWFILLLLVPARTRRRLSCLAANAPVLRRLGPQAHAQQLRLLQMAISGMCCCGCGSRTRKRGADGRRMFC